MKTDQRRGRVTRILDTTSPYPSPVPTYLLAKKVQLEFGRLGSTGDEGVTQ